MNITFAPRGILQIDDARITYRNFAGRGDKYNREGDRNFALIIPDQEIADALLNEGWNIKIKPPREEDGTPFMYMTVKVKFSDFFSPHIYLVTGKRMNKLDEESVACLDNISIGGVSLDIRPFDWTMPNGQCGRTAYLQAIKVIQRVDDRFSDEYDAQNEY